MSVSTMAGSRKRHAQLTGTSADASTLGHWSPPEDSWIKLNTDGARSSIDGNASCGGVLRNQNGGWRQSFGVLSQLCWKDWTIAFSKVDRRNNGVTDQLAKLVFVDNFDVMTFDKSPIAVVLVLNLVL
ncbi:hypothetical protein V6N13_147667 [Hibiscus sabdariffa]